MTKQMIAAFTFWSQMKRTMSKKDCHISISSGSHRPEYTFCHNITVYLHSRKKFKQFQGYNTKSSTSTKLLLAASDTIIDESNVKFWESKCFGDRCFVRLPRVAQNPIFWPRPSGLLVTMCWLSWDANSSVGANLLIFLRTTMTAFFPMLHSPLFDTGSTKFTSCYDKADWFQFLDDKCNVRTWRRKWHIIFLQFIIKL